MKLFGKIIGYRFLQFPRIYETGVSLSVTLLDSQLCYYCSVYEFGLSQLLSRKAEVMKLAVSATSPLPATLTTRISYIKIQLFSRQYVFNLLKLRLVSCEPGKLK
jgi:hypothetical protein